jgi:hypothetical protein
VTDPKAIRLNAALFPTVVYIVICSGEAEQIWAGPMPFSERLGQEIQLACRLIAANLHLYPKGTLGIHFQARLADNFSVTDCNSPARLIGYIRVEETPK